MLRYLLLVLTAGAAREMEVKCFALHLEAKVKIAKLAALVLIALQTHFFNFTFLACALARAISL